jgi:predicted nucleic acid-binding protein
MRSRVCVDASLVIWALTPSPLSPIARALLARWLEDGVALVAPSLFAFEVTSTLRRLVYHKELTAAEGEEAFEKFLKLPVYLANRRGIYPLAWQLAKELNRARAYDTAYLALAQIAGCELWTADRRLYNAACAKYPWVKWVEDSA